MGVLNFHHLFLVVVLLPLATPDIASDRAALLALRSAVGGRVLLWNLSSASPCSWAGVICSPDNSSVVELRLPGMGLSGQLPPNTISNLTNLQTLSLRFNSLSGPLPANMFSSLNSLRNIYMQNNLFIGGVPDSLFSVKSLVRLNLAHNNFSGPISASFNKLTRLGTLYLQNNHFSGSLPDLNLPALIQFDVSNNNLTGPIPSGLAGKPKSSFAGNSLCGPPLDSCAVDKPKKKLSAGAIAGIVIGSVIGFFLILLLILYLYRMVSGKGADRKGKEVEIQEAEIGGWRKGRDKGLVFFGNTGWDFDVEELLRASAEVLGKGTFGTAYKAVLETGLAVAVKRLRDVKMGEKELTEKMEEIGRMDHPNLVPLRAYYYNREEKLLVYDFLPMGSLSALLHGNKEGGRAALNWETRVAIALGAAQGISHIHSQGSSTSHGNIKSSNILLTNSYEARVSDFGLAQLGSSATPSHRVAGYRAPEVIDPHKVSHKADVYSFGVLVLELVTGKAPNEDGVDLPRWVQSVLKQDWTSKVFDVQLLRYGNVEEEMVQLLQLGLDCTAPYPDNRPSMPDITAKMHLLNTHHPTHIAHHE
ncbi:probable inactive receptor kinase At1g48480 [Salvia miltiorrhiza]|uniref:probable inactive receptor kinase At1g48480 n=1 Tax=Salvia miltiorrhiza TaxID=226208 RepID=UPI0025ACDAF7|nr:probable inactive receptor kinase At1g48480 [Salvia miltiorrhiza]